jgi:hypothetical protein
MQLQFPESENLSILFLAEIRTQLTGIYTLVVHTFDGGFVQETFVLGHKLSRVAGSQSHYQQPH